MPALLPLSTSCQTTHALPRTPAVPAETVKYHQHHRTTPAHRKHLLLSQEKRSCSDEQSKAHPPRMSPDPSRLGNSASRQHPHIARRRQQYHRSQKERHGRWHAAHQKGERASQVSPTRHPELDGEPPATPPHREDCRWPWRRKGLHASECSYVVATDGLCPKCHSG
jgi:hypothetical protein